MKDQEQNAENMKALTLAHFDYGKKLNSHAFFKTNSRATGEDLVQDTFLKTWKYLVKGGKIEVMKSFLYHILNNLIIDEYRKHKTTSLDVLMEKGYELKTDDSNKFIDFLDGKKAILLIRFLSVKYQKIIRMRYIQNLSLEEMSLITGQTRNAMAVQVHRGIEKLKIIYRTHLNRGYASI